VAVGPSAGRVYWDAAARPETEWGPSDGAVRDASGLYEDQRPCDGRRIKRYVIVSDQDLREARDRRPQFGHIQAGKVVALAQ